MTNKERCKKCIHKAVCTYQDYFDNVDHLGERCKQYMSKDIINRQKAEIEDLQRIVGLMNKRKYYRKFVDEVFRKQKGKELSDPDFDYIYQLFFEQKAEIENTQKLLQATINNSLAREELFQFLRTEAIKEVLDELISMCSAPHWCVWMSDIKDLKERMVGET